jgi:hypothetical protein
VSSFEMLGDCEIELPGYMSLLQPSEGCGPIIACGFHPGSNDLVVMTTSAAFYELNPFDFFSSQEVGYEVHPVENGKMIEFIHEDKIVTVDSQDILDACKEIQLADLEIGMKHENQVINPKKDDQGSDQ